MMWSFGRMIASMALEAAPNVSLKSVSSIAKSTCCLLNNSVQVLPKSKLHSSTTQNLRLGLKCGYQSFHTSSRRHVPPIVLLLLKPIAKFSAAMTGRGIRKWFRSLGPEERRHVMNKIKKYWYIPAGLVGTVSAGGVVYYVTHLEETPITGRKRFIAMTHEQIVKVAQAEADMLKREFSDRFHSGDSIEVRRVLDVAYRLLQANPELRQMKFDNWNVYVVNDPTVNACVLPTGDVFVFDGILQMANTQDQLAIILGHEMAHAVLEHGVEELSMASLVDVVIIFSLAALWCILPSDGIAAVTHYFYNKVIRLLTHMPHSRMVEKEADHVGVMFAAKACYDVRAGSLLWKKMALQEKYMNMSDGHEEIPLPEFMSTHPDSANRAEHLDFLLPQAEDWRNSMKCPKLPANDPREAIKVLSNHVDNHMAALRAGQDLRKVTKHPSVVKTS